MVKDRPANEGDTRDLGLGRSLGREDPLEEGVATQLSILACRIPWAGEPHGLQP